MSNKTPGISIICYILSLVSILFGLYKMFVYAGTSLRHPINAYVGGDAYNYIINANYATAFFVLGIFFVIVGFGFDIYPHITHRLEDGSQRTTDEE